MSEDRTEEILRLRRALEDVSQCRQIYEAQRIAHAALQELTFQEAAKEIGISRQRLHILFKQGRIKARRAGRFRLIPRSEINRLRQDRTEPAERRSSFYAIKKCAEWLNYCLKLGWAKDDLDDLEALWWQQHDEHGNLRASAN